MSKQKHVVILGIGFELDHEDFKDVNTLNDLENLDHASLEHLKGTEKAEAESQLFNALYAYKNNVDGERNVGPITIEPLNEMTEEEN